MPLQQFWKEASIYSSISSFSRLNAFFPIHIRRVSISQVHTPSKETHNDSKVEPTLLKAILKPGQLENGYLPTVSLYPFVQNTVLTSVKEISPDALVLSHNNTFLSNKKKEREKKLFVMPGILYKNFSLQLTWGIWETAFPLAYSYCMIFLELCT